MIPINDLRRPPTNASQRAREAEAASTVAASGWYFNGPHTRRFEEKLAALVGVDHGIGVASGTDALTLILSALGVGPGHRVATVANAGFYSSLACMRVGAEPTYVDVDPRTACMSPHSLASTLSHGRVDAVVVTHLYGRVADIHHIARMCKTHGVPLIEDCAQAIGARSHGRHVGSFGDAAAFSFYPTKNLGAIGDAGAVLTASEGLADRVRQLAQYGWSSKYLVEMSGGMNSRLDEIQAAILVIRMDDLEMMNQRRVEIVSYYADQLQMADASILSTTGEEFVAHLAVVEAPNRDDARSTLRKLGIDTEIHYPIPDHRQPTRLADCRAVSLPVTELLAERIFTVPCFPTMTDGEVEQVSAALVHALPEGDGPGASAQASQLVD